MIATAALIALIYSVRNTFGERHTYVAPVEPGELSEAGVRQTRTKIFHVSPFIDMGARYHFRVLPPGKVVRLSIHETEKGEPLLAATFVGEAKTLGNALTCSLPLEVPLHDVEDHGGNSLGSAETLAERGEVPQEPCPAEAGQLPRRRRHARLANDRRVTT